MSSSASSSSISSAADTGCTDGTRLCADFDASGALPAGWTTNSQRVTVSTEKAYSDTRALKVQANGGGYNSNFLSYDLTQQANLRKSIYGRMMINLSAAGTNGADFTFLQADGSARQSLNAPSDVNVMLRGRINGSNDRFMANYDTWNAAGNWQTDCWNHPATDPAPSQYFIPKDTWACVQWHFDAERNAMSYWVNNQSLSEINVVERGQGCVNNNTQNGIWWGPENFNKIHVGIEQYHGHAQARTMFIDDIAIDDRMVECPAAPGTGNTSSAPSSGAQSSAATSSQRSSVGVSSAATSSQAGGGINPMADAPVAGGMCAANTGLGSGGTGSEHVNVVLQDGGVVIVKAGKALEITSQSGSPLTNALAVTNGTYAEPTVTSFCMATKTGAIHCGERLKTNTSAVYTPANASDAVLSISSYTIENKFCALLANQKVLCGDASATQLLNTPSLFTHMSCGRMGCCGITTLGKMECWNGGVTPANQPSNMVFTGINDSSSCGITKTGASHCIGPGWTGEMPGIGWGNLNDFMAVTLPNTSPIVGYAGGQFHNCWVHADTTVTCAGSAQTHNAHGATEAPNTIKGADGLPLQDIIAVNAGKYAACATNRRGELFCWGKAGDQGATAVKIDLGNRSVRIPASCM